ncbi:MAG: phospholipid carrier-dependent glycosyltransferase [Bryobacteraceae bacterium]
MNRPPGLVRAAFWAAVAALLVTMGAVQVLSALQETQTWDEGIYLAAGYSYWKTGDYRMNREHPPLFKLLFALPLLPLNPSLPADRQVWDTADQADFSYQFMHQNRVPADTLLFLGRAGAILLTLLFGLLLVLWARREFGAAPAVLALFLFAFDPNLIAHSRYVTADLMVTLFIFLAVVTWAKFLETKRYRDLVLAAAMLSLALVSKFSALFLLPLLLLFYLLRWWQEGRGGRLSAKHLAVSLVIAGTICVATVCVVYGPETVRSIHGPRLTAVVDRSTPVSAALHWFGKRLGLPAHPYLVGLHAQAVHDHLGHPAYLMGQHSQTGWWYYFPVVFAVKTPTAVLLLCAACFGLALLWLARAGPLVALRGLRAIPLRWLVVSLTPAVYFLLSMLSHINIGIRHLLPVYPFLFVLLAAALFHKRLDRFRWARAGLLALVIAVLLAESVGIYPHYLAFFNTLAGGPGRGPEYLVDSNIDWGQDLKKLRKYLDSIRWKQPVCVAYFGRASMTYYGIEYQGLPTTDDLTGRGQVDCLAAISVTLLHDVYLGSASYRWLRERTPMAKVGYSIYVYDLRKPKP